MNPAVQAALDGLNEAFRCDPKAFARLLSFRVICNESLSEHPTLPVELVTPPPKPGEPADAETKSVFTMGTLGLLNCILIPIIGEAIAARYECDIAPDGKKSPPRLMGFMRYVEKPQRGPDGKIVLDAHGNPLAEGE